MKVWPILLVDWITGFTPLQEVFLIANTPRWRLNLSLPLIRNRHEALDLLREVSLDEDLRLLRHWFMSKDNVESAIGQLTSCLSAIRSAPFITASSQVEIEQIERLRSRWVSLVDRPIIQSGGPVLEELTRDATNWDFRLGLERDAIPNRTDLLPTSLQDIVQRIARNWGMFDSTPIEKEYDLIIPIGGLVQANIGRPASVARWMREGMEADSVLALASDRKSSPREAELAKQLGIPSATEQDSLRFGLEIAFSLDPNNWETDERVLARQYFGDTPIELAIAPPGKSGRRATTEEGLRWALEQMEPTHRTSAMLVTTSIYWIANQISARIALPTGVEVTTCGYDMKLAPGPVKNFKAQHYLQEIKATVDALPKLRDWASR